MKEKISDCWNMDTEIRGVSVPETKCQGHKNCGFKKTDEKVILNECEDSY